MSDLPMRMLIKSRGEKVNQMFGSLSPLARYMAKISCCIISQSVSRLIRKMPVDTTIHDVLLKHSDGKDI